MNKSILVGAVILTLSTSAAFAAHKAHHSHAMKPTAAAAATNPAGPVVWPGAGSSSDRDMYARNLHDSGMDKMKPQ